jgi:hypothetical protein
MGNPDEEDVRFFFQRPDRRARIRMPQMVQMLDKQRAVHFQQECEQEFRSLGPHDKSRRRIILWKILEDNPHYNPKKPGILKIPFLAFADETIEDNDAILLPILDGIMRDPSNVR